MFKTISRLFVVGLLLSCQSVEAQRTITLGELFSLVEQGSKALSAQRTGEEAAQEGVVAARRNRLPDVGANLSVSYIGNALLTDRHFQDAHGLSSPHFGNNFALEAQQTIYAGGAVQAGIDKAETARDAAKVATLQTREDERFAALGQYLELEKIDHRIEVVKENIQLTEKLVGQIKDKMNQGVALKNDVTRYDLQLQTLRLDLEQLQNQRSIANHQLCNTLGLPTDEVIQPTNEAEEQAFGHSTEDAWQQQARLTSPSLQLSQLEAKMARHDVKMARSELLPHVAVVAADNFDGPITYELPPIDKNINIWYVGVGVKYSLSSLWKSNRKLRQAKAVARQKEQQTAVAAQRLDNAVQQAHTLYEQAYVELKTQQKKVQLARENYDVMNERYLNQLALVTDMVDASNVKLDAELQEADARINIAFAYFKMKYLAGEL